MFFGTWKDFSKGKHFLRTGDLFSSRMENFPYKLFSIRWPENCFPKRKGFIFKYFQIFPWRPVEFLYLEKTSSYGQVNFFSFFQKIRDIFYKGKGFLIISFCRKKSKDGFQDVRDFFLLSYFVKIVFLLNKFFLQVWNIFPNERYNRNLRIYFLKLKKSSPFFYIKKEFFPIEESLSMDLCGSSS